MSTAIGVALFVIGLSALLLSVLMDRRPPSRERAAAEGTDVQTSGTSQGETDIVVGEPDVMAPTTEDLAVEAEATVPQLEPEPEVPAPSTAPATAPATTWSPAARPGSEPAMSPDDRASAAQARLAKLRAELVGSPGPSSEPELEPEPEPVAPEPVAPAEASTRPDARRVFAAVASVGRAPEEETAREPEQPAPAPAEAEQPTDTVPATEGLGTAEETTPAAEVEEPPDTGHRHSLPLVNHSDLVTHLRREHLDLESSGSTIQMRILHERAHASSV